MAFLTVKNISREEQGKFTVRDISFNQDPFQKIVIAGETGSGKTTLLKMIGGSIQPTSGEIRFRDKRVLGPWEQLLPGQPDIAYLSQHFELRNHYRVHEMLEYANTLPVEKSIALYTVCRIEHLLQRRTDQLSGGERQRIALARLLSTSPRLLLLDEPFSNLDMIHKKIMKSVIHDLSEKLGITCLMALHEAPDILSWADTILIMKKGEIIQQGKPAQVYKQPVNEYCAGLFGSYNIISPVLAAMITNSKRLEARGKKIMVRPEDILVHKTTEKQHGIVQGILFWGNYFTIDVAYMQEQIRVQTNDGSFRVGDRVMLSATTADLGYLA
jgi:iron(III) transport system ATP-binding protein